MGARQISISNYNDENGSGTTGGQHPFPPTCFCSSKTSGTQGPRAREDIRSHKSSK